MSHSEDNQESGKLNSDRVAGQGNSKDGLTRRLGSDLESRGLKNQQQIKSGEGNGEEERIQEGSQGSSRGQVETPGTDK